MGSGCTGRLIQVDSGKLVMLLEGRVELSRLRGEQEKSVWYELETLRRRGGYHEQCVSVS